MNSSPADKRTCKLSAVEDAQAVHGSGGQRLAKKPAALVLVAAAYLIGGGGMLAWLAFLLLGPWMRCNVKHGSAGVFLLDALLCLIFFAQHSLMVRRRFRVWLTRTVRAEFHGALYAIASGACLLLLAALWQPAGSAWWEPDGWIRGAMLVVFLAAGAAAGWGARSLDDFDALGVKPALRVVTGDLSAASNPFTVRGPYRWVRHPLYLFSLIMIWSSTVFTPDRLLHNVLWTIWIVCGAILEERDLLDCFGDAYRSYRESVPMLLPRSLKALTPEFSQSISNDT